MILGLLLALACVLTDMPASYATTISGGATGATYYANCSTATNPPMPGGVARTGPCYQITWLYTFASQTWRSWNLDSSDVSGATAACYRGGATTSANGCNNGNFTGTYTDTSDATGPVYIWCANGSTNCTDWTWSLHSTSSTGAIDASWSFTGSSYQTTPLCSGVTAAGSYVGTTLAVRLSGVTAVPPGGWRVDAPDPGSTLPGTASLTMGSGNAVDNSPGTYYGTATVSADAAMTARVTALASGGAASCYLSLSLSSNAVSQTPTDTTNPGSSDVGGSCSWSWNIFRGLVCLFAPSQQQLTSWNTKIDSIKAHPPVDVMVGGYTFIQDVYGSANCAWDSSAATGSCAGMSANSDGTVAGQFQSPDAGGSGGPHTVDFLAAAANMVQTTPGGQVVYDLATIGVWIAFLWWAWHRVSKSFGGKE